MTKDTFLPIAAFILDPRKSAVDLDRELARMKTDELEKRLGERKVTSQNKAIYQAFIDDPHLHLRTDLGPHYRAGVLGIKRPSHPKHRAAWNAGRDAVASGVKLDLPPAMEAERASPFPKGWAK